MNTAILQTLSTLGVGVFFIISAIGTIAVIDTSAAKPFRIDAHLPVTILIALIPWLELCFGVFLAGRRSFSDRPVRLFAQILIGVVFVGAAVEKIANPDAFAKNINNFHMLPYGMLNIAALILPWVELILGLGLLFGFYVRSNALLAAALLVMFMGAVGWAMSQGYNINCGCFGEASSAAAKEVSKVGWAKLLENSRWTLAAVIVLIWPAFGFKEQWWSPHGTAPNSRDQKNNAAEAESPQTMAV